MNRSDIENILSEASFSFSRSGGKGGQNVNKVETKVELIFNINDSQFLTDEEKIVVSEKLKNRIDSEGNLRVRSQSERSQLGNRKKAIGKLIELILKALETEKKRVPTRKSSKAKIKVLEKKKKHGEKKKERKKINVILSD